jgi:very-short-patch-repair endonuclease
MGIISEKVQVKVATKTFKHYKELGYEFYHCGDEIDVNVEDLTNSSHIKILVSCDKCNKIKNVIYRDYINALNKNGHYYCQSCAQITFLADEIRSEKVIKSRTGRKGGYKRSDETKEKFVATMKERYGVENPAQSPEMLEKAAKTYYKNSSKKCSKQQFYIYNLYGKNNLVELNYPISYYNADICLIDEKLICEYDGGGHLLNVITGKINKEEHMQKEIIRFSVLKRAGYKQMRIISSKDKLPSDEVLFQMLFDARNYFSKYPSHSWIEFNIDTSSVYNAEHIDGVQYDYGKLRFLKDSDLSNLLYETNIAM